MLAVSLHNGCDSKLCRELLRINVAASSPELLCSYAPGLLRRSIARFKTGGGGPSLRASLEASLYREQLPYPSHRCSSWLLPSGYAEARRRDFEILNHYPSEHLNLRFARVAFRFSKCRCRAIWLSLIKTRQLYDHPRFMACLVNPILSRDREQQVYFGDTPLRDTFRQHRTAASWDDSLSLAIYAKSY
jgi:hypothetical protein